MTNHKNTDQPLCVGVWLCLPSGTHWRGEGIGRTIEWVISGLKESGLLGKHVNLKIVVSEWILNDIKDSFKQFLGDLDGVEFIGCASQKYRFIRLLDRIFSLNGLLCPPNIYYKDPADLNRIIRLSKDEVSDDEMPGLLANNAAKRQAKFLGVDRLRNQVAELYNFPPQPQITVKKPKLPFGEDYKTYKAQKKELDEYLNKVWGVISEKLINETKRPPLPGIQNLKKIEKQILQIPIINKFYSLGMRVVNSYLSRSEKLDASHDAFNIDDRVDVDLWWSPTPNIFGVEYLRKPVVANFWDFVIGEYGFLWPKKELESIYARVKIVLHKASAVLTQSQHNVKSKLLGGFMVDPDVVSVCYLTAPRSYAESLPTYAKQGKTTPQTKAEASDIIHDYLLRKQYIQTLQRSDYWRQRGLEIERLKQFDFINNKFFICSTQNRPYKNLAFMVKSFLWMLDQYKEDVYLIMTSEFDLSDKKDEVAQVIKKSGRTDRIFVMSRVPNKVHAALYHTAVGTLHPSHSEGGVGSYPFLEGMIMGTPGLIAEGEYSREGQRLHSDYHKVVMSSTNYRRAGRKMRWLLNNVEEAYQEQLPIFMAHNKWKWSDVADVYIAEMFKVANKPLPSVLQNRLKCLLDEPHFTPSESLKQFIEQ